MKDKTEKSIVNTIEEIWNDYNLFVNVNRYHEGLMYFFMDLLKLSNDPKNCEEFIKDVVNRNLDSILIIHMLNVFARIKDKISNWELLIKKAQPSLIRELGYEDATKIINFYE